MRFLIDAQADSINVSITRIDSSSSRFSSSFSFREVVKTKSLSLQITSRSRQPLGLIKGSGLTAIFCWSICFSRKSFSYRTFALHFQQPMIKIWRWNYMKPDCLQQILTNTDFVSLLSNKCWKTFWILIRRASDFETWLL